MSVPSSQESDPFGGGGGGGAGAGGGSRIQDAVDQRDWGEVGRCLNSVADSPIKSYNESLIDLMKSRSPSTKCLIQEDIVIKSPLVHSIMVYNEAFSLCLQHKAEAALPILLKEFNDLSKLDTITDPDHHRIYGRIIFLIATIYAEDHRNPDQALTFLSHLQTNVPDHSFHPPRVQHLRAKCLLQQQNWKAAKKEMRGLRSEILLRSHIELMKGNVKKCNKIFHQLPSEGTSDSQDSNSLDPSESTDFKVTPNDIPDRELPLMKNNAAIITFSIGQRAQCVHSFVRIGPSITAHPEMVFNLGQAHLSTGNGDKAYQVFCHLTKRFPQSPKLWFKCAESLFHSHRHCFIKNPIRSHGKLLDFTVGSGSHRKMVLTGNHPVERNNANDLMMIRGLLSNCLVVMNSTEKSYYPCNTLIEPELNRFKVNLLLAHCFMSISLQDYCTGLSYARSCMRLNPTGLHKVLNNVYAGVCLLWLDRVDSAISHFCPSYADEVPVSIEESNVTTSDVKGFKGWFPVQAKHCLTYNRAVALSFRQEYDKAVDTLRNIPLIQLSSDAESTLTPVDVFSLNVYIQLKQGNMQEAKKMLRETLQIFSLQIH